MSKTWRLAVQSVLSALVDIATFASPQRFPFSKKCDTCEDTPPTGIPAVSFFIAGANLRRYLTTSIPDDGNIGYYDIEVSGLPTATGADFGVETVCIDLMHAWNADPVPSPSSHPTAQAELPLTTAVTPMAISIPASTPMHRRASGKCGGPSRALSGQRAL